VNKKGKAAKSVSGAGGERESSSGMSIFSQGGLVGLRGDVQKAFYELPDFDLSSLQEQIKNKELEELYKRYEQRAQIGELQLCQTCHV
jgi:hypothetical protein